MLDKSSAVREIQLLELDASFERIDVLQMIAAGQVETAQLERTECVELRECRAAGEFQVTQLGLHSARPSILTKAVQL